MVDYQMHRHCDSDILLSMGWVLGGGRRCLACFFLGLMISNDEKKYLKN